MTGSMLWQAIGWLALGLNVWGNLQLTGKSVNGWLIRLSVNILWIIYSAYQHAWPLLGNHAIFVFINIYGWLKWRKAIIAPSPEYVEAQRLRNGLASLEIEFRHEPHVVHAIRRIRVD